MAEVLNRNDAERAEDAVLPIHRYMTFVIDRLQSKLMMQASRHLKEVGDISIPRYRVLACLGIARKNTFTALAEAAHIDRGALSRTLKSMTEDGLIIRTVNESDQREHVLKLTREGERKLEHTRKYVEARQYYLRSLLTEDELRCFFTVCEKLSIGAEADSFE